MFQRISVVKLASEVLARVRVAEDLARSVAMGIKGLQAQANSAHLRIDNLEETVRGLAAAFHSRDQVDQTLKEIGEQH